MPHKDEEVDFDKARPAPEQKIIDHFMAPGPEDVEKLADVGKLEFPELCEAQIREYKQVSDRLAELEKLKTRRREELLHNMRGMEQAQKGKFIVRLKKRGGGTQWKEMFTAIAGEPKKEDLDRFKGQDQTVVDIVEIP